MLFTCILIGIGIGLIAGALVISAYELTTDIIRSRVKAELPSAAYVEISRSFTNKSVTKLPLYTAKAYNSNHEKICDINFEYTNSEYFYDGEKITI